VLALDQWAKGSQERPAQIHYAGNDERGENEDHDQNDRKGYGDRLPRGVLRVG
jgi:hypothetical protein